MAFYKSIAEQYDHIFPLQPIQVEFVKNSFLNVAELNILDIGCGTGSLSMALSPFFKKITGIDPDKSMLEKAEIKSGGSYPNLRFHDFGMLDLNGQFEENIFDGILCFGNTVVHLESLKEIGAFFHQSRHVLKPNGKLLIQLINYNRILDENIMGLPTIENEQIKFVRKYQYDPKRNTLDFETILTIKESMEEISNSIKLLPVGKEEIEKLLEKENFRNIRFYGSFKRDPLLASSIPLIIEAKA